VFSVLKQNFKNLLDMISLYVFLSIGVLLFALGLGRDFLSGYLYDLHSFLIGCIHISMLNFISQR